MSSANLSQANLPGGEGFFACWFSAGRVVLLCGVRSTGYPRRGAGTSE